MLRLVRAGAALLALLMAAAACGDSPSEPTSPIASYTLLNVDGDAVPSTLFEDDLYSLVVTHATLEMEEDFTFLIAIDSRETVATEVSEYADTLRGTWSQGSAGGLQFTVTDDNSVHDGTWQGRRVTVDLETEFFTGAFVFQRDR